MFAHVEEIRRGVLLDRDGVLIEDRPDYVRSVDQVRFVPGVEDALSQMFSEGYTICVVSNQAGVGKGLYTAEAVWEIHRFLEEHFRASAPPAFRIHWYFCPHRDEDRCPCRKPQPGLLTRAMREHALRPEETWMVGDSVRDIEAGARAGCRTALVRTGHGKDATFSAPPIPEAVFPSLVEFASGLVAEASSAKLQKEFER